MTTKVAILVLMGLCVCMAQRDLSQYTPIGQTRPVNPSFLRPATRPERLPQYHSLNRPLRPAVLPGRITREAQSDFKQTKPLPRPQRPQHAQTLPGSLGNNAPQTLGGSLKQTRPFARPQQRPQTLPASLGSNGPQTLEGSLKQTRPFVRPQRPQTLPATLGNNGPQTLEFPGKQTKPAVRPQHHQTLPANLDAPGNPTRPIIGLARPHNLPGTQV